MKECTVRNAKQISGLHYTVNHTGKMEGMQSISTSVIENSRCAKNAQIKGSICEKCFASKQVKIFPSMQKPLAKNQEILTSRILDDHEIPTIYAKYFRFESFGDLNNDIQVINYFKHCYKNPDVKFALWTKNPDYIATAIKKGYEKPNNLNIVLSSLFINVQRKTRYEFVDKVFTVYDKQHIGENETNINCGSRSCFKCGLCYEKNDVKIINEKLK